MGLIKFHGALSVNYKGTVLLDAPLHGTNVLELRGSFALHMDSASVNPNISAVVLMGR